MSGNQIQQRNDNNRNTQPVGFGAPGQVVDVSVFDGFSDLVGQRSGNRAGEISWANGLSLFETQELEILVGSTAVAMSAGSRCCPSGNSFAFSDQLQSEASVNIFDSSVANLTFGQGVRDYHHVGSQFNLGEYVVGPNQSEQEQHDAAGLDTVLLIEPNGLNHGQSSQYQARYGNYVARSRSVIHSQILSRQEANYVAG